MMKSLDSLNSNFHLFFICTKGEDKQGRRSDGMAKGSKGNARALQTDDEGSEPKIRWIWGAPPGNVFAATPF